MGDRRFTTVTCLFYRQPADATLDGAVRLRPGRFSTIATFRRDELEDVSLDSRFEKLTPESSESWSHVAVIVSTVARAHSVERAAIYEDAWFADAIARVKKTAGGHLVLADGKKVILQAYTKSTHSAWAYLKEALAPDAYFQLRDTVLEIVDYVRCPYPVIEYIGYDSYSAETALVWHDDRMAVCKLFRHGFPHHFESEVRGLQLADRLGVGPSIFEIGPNWILMEYLRDYSPLRLGWNRLLPLSYCRTAFSQLRRLHEEGLAMFDFNINNVMIGSGHDVKIIDFADSFLYREPIPDFSRSPVVAGDKFFDFADVQCEPGDFRLSYFRSNGPGATYDKDWYPYVGVPIDVLMSGRGGRFIGKRGAFFLTKRLPDALRKLAMV